MNYKSYNFFISNFGPYIGPHGPIVLEKFTWFTGTNGSGKTALLDAIKTLFFVNQDYISYNPDGDEKRTQREYIRTFQKEKKRGPTILAIHVAISEEFRDYTILFGITCEQSIRWKYFIKKEITLKQSDLIIKNSTSSNDLITNLKNPNLKGSFPNITNTEEYHNFLRNYELFYTPPVSQKNLDYHQYLMLMRESTDAFAGKKRLNIEKIKRSLFHNLSDPKEIVGTVEQIKNGISELNDLSEKKILTENRLSILEDLLIRYQEHYETFVFQDLLLDILYNEQKKNDYSMTINDLSSKKEEIENENEALKQKIERNEFVIPSLETNIEKLENFILASRDSYYFFQQNNEKYINKEKDFYANKWKELHDTSKRKSDEFKRLRNQYRRIKADEKGFDAKFQTQKESKDVLKNNSQNLKKKIERKRKKAQEISNNITELENTITNLNENQNKISREWIKVKDFSRQNNFPLSNDTISSENLSLLKENANTEEYQIELVKNRYLNLESRITDLKGLKFEGVEVNEKILDSLKKRYNFVQVLDLLEKYEEEELSAIESLLKPYMHYFIINSSNQKELEQFSLELLEIGISEAGFLRLDQREIELALKTTSNLKDKSQLGWIIKDNLAQLSTREPPIYFNINIRKEVVRNFTLKMEALEFEFKSRNKNLEIIKNHVEEFNKFIMLREYEKNKIKEKYGTASIENQHNEEIKSLTEVGKKIDLYESEKEENIGKKTILDSQIENIENEKEKINSQIEESKSKRKEKRKEIEELEKRIIEAEKESIQYEKIMDEYSNTLNFLKSELNWLIENISDQLGFSISQFLNDKKYLILMKNRLETERKNFSGKLRNLELEKVIWRKNIGTNLTLIEEVTKEKSSLEISVEKLSQKVKLEKQRIKEIFIKKLLEEVSLYEIFDTNYNNWYRASKESIESSLTNCQNNLSVSFDECYKRMKTKFASKIAEDRTNFIKFLIPNVLEVFQIPQKGSFIDSEENLTLKYLHTQLNLNLDSIKIRKYFNQKIETIISEITTITRDFQDNIQLLVNLIKDQVKLSHKKVRDLNDIASFADFGKMGKIEFIFQTNSQFESLKNSELKLIHAAKEGILKELISNWFGEDPGSFTDNLAKFIFNDKSKKDDDLIDVFNYYDFDVESIRLTGERLRATKGSTGESIGLKFLIFAAIIDSFKHKPEHFTQTESDIFLFVDEIARLDPKGINSIIEISKKFDITVLFAERNLPKIIIENQLSYIIENGIILPGSSELLLGAEKAFDIS